jgi:flagellar basal-body rod protein FlgC
MKLENVFTGLSISAMGLAAQRKRMNAIASNLANAETTKTDTGGPYKRKIIELTAKGAKAFSGVMRQAGMHLSTTNASHMRGGDPGSSRVSNGVPQELESKEVEDKVPPKIVYDPGNPDADPNGYVRMPNINVVTEMVNMIAASRSFEANVAAINAAKTMAKDSLEI